MAYLKISPQGFRHRLLGGNIEESKKWIKIGRIADISRDYAKIVQSIPTDRKVYAIAVELTQSLTRTPWYTHIGFRCVPVDINDYTPSYVNNQFYVKAYATDEVVLDIECYNQQYRTKSTPLSDFSEYYKIKDSWSREPILVEGNDAPDYLYVYYFSEPLYLIQLQASINIEYFYVLIDEKPAPEELVLYLS